MSSSIRFFVAGDPKGQPRPRAFSMRVADRVQTRVYDPKTADGWKLAVVEAAMPVVPAMPIAGPIAVKLWFNFRRPKSHFRTGNFANELRVDAPVFHLGTPDTDNLAKAVMDAITTMGKSGRAFWGDDAQVAELFVQKTYSVNPGVHVEISRIEAPGGTAKLL